MSGQAILIVDDEPNILSSLRRALEIEDYCPCVARSGAEALAAVADKRPDAVLLDVAMPEMDGLQVLERLKARDPTLPVIMMSGHSTIETAVQATKLGAYDFVEKPLSTDRLLISIHNALDAVRLRAENAALRELAAAGARMVGSGAKMKAIHETIRKTAPTNGRVLISGANGTGKELVARALHDGSRRAAGPYVKVNCAAIPQELIESELFGHEKGAFSGAVALRHGRFEQAHGGTLFLDEIGDMSLGAQAKVLRALQEGELERVGGSETIRVDVRVIAATNKDLAAEIAAGRFREDLYYRLNVVPIALPALRERKEDIPALVEHFLALACRDHGIRERRIAQAAVTLLMQHDWPGNVRELRNTIERLVILAEGETIGEPDVRAVLPAAKAVQGHYRAGASLRDMLLAAERDVILRALEDCEGHVSRTAAALQLERSHLYKKMRSLGIDPRQAGLAEPEGSQ
jgi:DNA-binding NtrC family response regulator